MLYLKWKFIVTHYSIYVLTSGSDSLNFGPKRSKTSLSFSITLNWNPIKPLGRLSVTHHWRCTSYIDVDTFHVGVQLMNESIGEPWRRCPTAEHKKKPRLKNYCTKRRKYSISYSVYIRSFVLTADPSKLCWLPERRTMIKSRLSCDQILCNYTCTLCECGIFPQVTVVLELKHVWNKWVKQ